MAGLDPASEQAPCDPILLAINGVQKRWVAKSSPAMDA
jgi:hypothetical protein